MKLQAVNDPLKAIDVQYTKKHRTMENILVPTNFSENCTKAANMDLKMTIRV